MTNHRTRKVYSREEKKRLIQKFMKSGMTIKAFAAKSGVAPASISRWMKSLNIKRSARNPRYSPEQKRATIEAFQKSAMTMKDFAKMWGINAKTLSSWLKSYDRKGPKGLEPGQIYGEGKKRGPKGLPQILVNEIIEAKKSFPAYGLRKIQNTLFRLKGVKVSSATVRKILESEGIHQTPPPPPKRRHPRKIRRFERALPMQLWQSDITSYVLTRHSQRVYLVVFMDDNSRYIVSWGLNLKQTGEFVMETVLDGIQRFGKPEEILTDQGRQYFSWRGKSEFQKLLDKQGIKHVVARSHHPQTVGKCERFWKTVGEEFWDRARPQELREARERFSHFVSHYNHFRPHQGLNGMIPADRFFGVESEVRQAIEDNLTKNELRIALDEAPRSPVFMVGQIGDKQISMHGEAGRLVVQTPSGEIQKLDYEDFGHHKGGTHDDSGSTDTDERESAEKATENRQTAGIQDAAAGDSGAGAAGECHGGGEKESPSDGGYDNGVLDGSGEQAGGCPGPISPPAQDMADEQSGLERDGSRAYQTAESEEEDDLPESAGRSGGLEAEDPGTRTDHRDAGSSDCHSPLHARLPGRSTPDRNTSTESCEEDQGTREEAWSRDEESTDTAENSRSKWGFGFWKKNAGSD